MTSPFTGEQSEAEREDAETKRQVLERAAQEQKERERDQQQRMARERIEKAKRERERIKEESGRRAKERSTKQSPPPVPLPRYSSPRTPTPPDRNVSLITSPARLASGSPISVDQGTYSRGEGHAINTSRTTPPFKHMTTNSDHQENDLRSPLARNPSREQLGLREEKSLPRPPTNEEPDPVASFPYTGLPNDFGNSTTSIVESNDIEAKFRAKLQHMSIPDEPRSRFSATTVATTVYDSSPPQSPGSTPSLPPSAGTTNSILNRKRPVAPSGAIRRKPTPSQTGTPNGISRKESKSLPKPPPDAETVDPIATLQAKVDVLRRRRRNLENVIHELTNVVQPSVIGYDRASRAEIKKTVAQLDNELAEVTKDEHETGLRLHRAWKRHEEFADFEPTSIWVRRVTN